MRHTIGPIALAVLLVAFLGSVAVYVGNSNKPRLNDPATAGVYPPKLPAFKANVRFNDGLAAIIDLPKLEYRPLPASDFRRSILKPEEFNAEVEWAIHKSLMLHFCRVPSTVTVDPRALWEKVNKVVVEEAGVRIYDPDWFHIYVKQDDGTSTCIRVWATQPAS